MCIRDRLRARSDWFDTNQCRFDKQFQWGQRHLLRSTKNRRWIDPEVWNWGNRKSHCYLVIPETRPIMQTYRKIEKNEANIYKFLSAFKKGRRHIFLAFGVPLLWVFIDKLLGLHPPNFITILVGFFASIKLLQWIYIFWLGNARCPQCGATPVSYTHLDVYKRQPVCWTS